jgi:hypothetical protein
MCCFFDAGALRSLSLVVSVCCRPELDSHGKPSLESQSMGNISSSGDQTGALKGTRSVSIIDWQLPCPPGAELAVYACSFSSADKATLSAATFAVFTLLIFLGIPFSSPS